MRSAFENGGSIGVLRDYTDDTLFTGPPATITFVGQTSATFEGSTTVGTTISLTGLGLQNGDIVIVAYESCGTTDKAQVIAGYTTVADLYANDTEDSNLLVAYKIMGTVPDTSVTIPATGNAADAGAVVVQAYRGVDISTPLDVTRTTVSLINTAIPDPPAITPVTSGARIVVAAGAAHTTGTGVFTASYLSNFLSVVSNDTNDATVGMGNVSWTSETYNPAAWTFTGTNSTNFSTNSVTMALRPGFELGNKKNSAIWNITAEKNSKTTFLNAGEITYTETGLNNFVVPTGVTSISAVCIGGGGGGGARGSNTDEPGAGGGGGALAYATLSVTPGETLTVTVGAGGNGGQTAAAAGTAGGSSVIRRAAAILVGANGGAGGAGGNNGVNPTGGAGGTILVGTGGSGGQGGNGQEGTNGRRGGGGGAGGYSGPGGAGGNNGGNGSNGTGGGGGGGGGTSTQTTTGGGGGVGLLGQGSNGTAGTASVNATGGSGGNSASYAGGLYGGGGSGGGSTNRTNAGARGAIRIIWGPYSYPNNAGNIVPENVQYGIIFPNYVERY
jgi:hypothetical protein